MAATVVEAIVEPNGFALGTTFEALTNCSVRLERFVAQNTDRHLSLLWVNAPTQAALEDALYADPSVENFELATDLGDQWLYRITWSDRIEALIGTVVAERAVLLEAAGSANGWELKLLFFDREAIRPTQTAFRERGVEFEGRRIYTQRKAEFDITGLTDKQHRTLTLALEHGYYGVPRRIDAKTLASKLGISHQALSEQLRRAHKSVVDSVIGPKASESADRINPAD